MNGINLSAFFVGAATMYFAMYVARIFAMESRTRYIFVLWTLLNLKDILITFPSLYTPQMLNAIIICDGWSAISYTVLVFELTQPRWTTKSRLLKLCIPFAAFTLLYAVWPVERVVQAYVCFLFVYAWTIVFIAYFRARRYIRYIRANYSNIDRLDISWLRIVFLFAIISQLAWLATSLIANSIADTIYYISTIVMWQVVLHYSWDIKPIEIEDDTERETDAEKEDDAERMPVREYTFVQRLEELMEQEELYLKKDLTLNELAAAINTNRTYLSDYFSTVCQQTFYDYINHLRIYKKSIPLMEEHPEYTIDHIANKSGFNSTSTFRRAFFKITGQRPRDYHP